MTHRASTRPKVLLTGDFQTPEFQSTVAWLKERADVDCSPRLNDAAEHIRRLETDPLLIVVAQSYPGQFSAGQIERLHRQTPLSRIVALLGSWCEGEERSGRPWPGVMRIYWHQSQTRLARLLDDFPDCHSAALQPRTATAAELLSEVVEPSDLADSGLVAIRTLRYTDFDALGEALRMAGYATVWLRANGWTNVRHATAVVWDAGHCDWNQPQQLDELKSLSEIAPVVALMDFPRHDDRTLIEAAGASAVVSRPFLIGDLVYQIDRLAETAPLEQSAA